MRLPSSFALLFWLTLLMWAVEFWAAALEPVGLEQLTALDRLPYFKPGVRVRYVGSIDKQGGNADWDWWLYQELETGEWVIFDDQGPGCIYNFVQHRYPVSREPVFRYYFDGETTPRLTIKQSEFGRKTPFVQPLASIYEGDDPVPSGRGPIWVIRSFVPMPYRKSCKITSSVKLEGFDRARGQGGWGHVVYHSYASAKGVKTFTGKENYQPVLAMLNAVGRDPKPARRSTRIERSGKLAPGQSSVLLDHRGAGSLGEITLNLADYAPLMLQTLRLRIYWDGATEPAVDAPLGAFYGNELGLHPVRYLTHGMNDQGGFYNYFPMPFWQSARMELCNESRDRACAYQAAIRIDRTKYPADQCGHFRIAYYPATPTTRGTDSILARLKGCGHVVAGTITMPLKMGISCEGDVRVYVDGCLAPQVESDGSESWSGHGWGFPTPGVCNPFSGYDGEPDSPWSQTRLLLGDWYPFGRQLVFGIEAQGRNDLDMAHSGAIFYYGRPDRESIVETDRVDVGDPASETAHGYHADAGSGLAKLSSCYEGDDDETVIADTGRVIAGFSEFTVRVDQDNQGVLLRRRSDQRHGRQQAKLYIDGKQLKERDWYHADRNSFKRWLDDELDIPPSYTRGKRSLKIRIEPVALGATSNWNEYQYWILCHRAPGQAR